MKLSPSNRPSWNLSPGDLPRAELIEREPLLADLENNAVFRLLVLTSKRTGAPGNGYREWPLIVGNLLIGGLSLDGIFSPRVIPPVLSIWLLMTAVAMIVWYCCLVAVRGKNSGLISIDKARLRDLLSAGTPYEDFVIGVWGFGASRSNPGRALAIGILICTTLSLCAGFVVTSERMPVLLSLPPIVITILATLGVSYWGDRRGVSAALGMLGLGIYERANPLYIPSVFACGLIPLTFVIVFSAELERSILARPWLLPGMLIASMPVGILSGYAISPLATAERSLLIGILEHRIREVLAPHILEEYGN